MGGRRPQVCSCGSSQSPDATVRRPVSIPVRYPVRRPVRRPASIPRTTGLQEGNCKRAEFGHYNSHYDINYYNISYDISKVCRINKQTNNGTGVATRGPAATPPASREPCSNSHLKKSFSKPSSVTQNLSQNQAQ